MTALAVITTCSVLALSPAPTHASSSTHVQVVFIGSGKVTVDQTYVGPGGSCPTTDVGTLNWRTTYDTTIDNGVLQSGTGSLGSGPGSMHLTIGGVCPKVTGSGCTVQLSAGSSVPGLSIGGGHIEAQAVGGSVFASCSANEFLGSDLSVINASLPGSLTGVINSSSGQVGMGSTFKVSSARAPASIASSCLGVGSHGSGDISCTASMSWSGTIMITCPKADQIGTVTTSASGGLPVGAPICRGQTIKTGKGQRVEITLKDGGLIRIGPNSKIKKISEKTNARTRSISDTFHLVLGRVWAEMEKLGGHDFSDEDQGLDAAPGVRGSAFTESVTRGGVATFHVIAGKGFAKLREKTKTVHFSAGYTARITHTSLKIGTKWPAADRALVPLGKRPPKLTKVKFAKASSGPRARLTLNLNEAATLKASVLQGKHRVATYKARGHRGGNKFRPLHHALRPGRYAMIVIATNNHRVSLAKLKFHV